MVFADNSKQKVLQAVRNVISQALRDLCPTGSPPAAGYNRFYSTVHTQAKAQHARATCLQRMSGEKILSILGEGGPPSTRATQQETETYRVMRKEAALGLAACLGGTDESPARPALQVLASPQAVLIKHWNNDHRPPARLQFNNHAILPWTHVYALVRKLPSANRKETVSALIAANFAAGNSAYNQVQW